MEDRSHRASDKRSTQALKGIPERQLASAQALGEPDARGEVQPVRVSCEDYVAEEDEPVEEEEQRDRQSAKGDPVSALEAAGR